MWSFSSGLSSPGPLFSLVFPAKEGVGGLKQREGAGRRVLPPSMPYPSCPVVPQGLLPPSGFCTGAEPRAGSAVPQTHQPTNRLAGLVVGRGGGALQGVQGVDPAPPGS